MKSNRALRRAKKAIPSSASRLTIFTSGLLPSKPQPDRLDLITRMQRGLQSTNVTNFAPRLNASRPMLPVPAHRSRKLELIISPPRMLNTDSFTRSEVGRTVFALTEVKRLPLNFPEMILIRFLSRKHNPKRFACQSIFQFVVVRFTAHPEPTVTFGYSICTRGLFRLASVCSAGFSRDTRLVVGLCNLSRFNLTLEILIVNRRWSVPLERDLEKRFNLILEMLIVDRPGEKRYTLQGMIVSISHLRFLSLIVIIREKHPASQDVLFQSHT